MGSNHAWAASATWVGAAFSFLPFHLISVYFGFLEKTSWKSVVGKTVATCFSFEVLSPGYHAHTHCHVIMTSACCSSPLLLVLCESLNEFEVF